MQISVVMTTYNGKEHLEKQLLSLRQQQRAPDEVLIFDDGSTDGTLEELHAFVRQNSLTNWHIQVNPERKGWKQNFMDGMRQAHGELIFPCDQDDIWYPQKLQEMEEVMEQDPQILLLACDYHVVYEQGALKAKVYKKTEAEAAELVTKYNFTKHFFMNPYPGCSYAVRKSFFDDVQEKWFAQAPHDEFLWLMATMQDGAWFYNRTLMDYVRYASNASGIHYKDIPMQQENLHYIAEMLERMELFGKEHPDKVPPAYRRDIETARAWCAKRQTLMHTRNPLRWLMLAPWWGYYNSFPNCLSDLWLVLFGRFSRG